MWIKQCIVIAGGEYTEADDNVSKWVRDNPQFKIDKFTYYKGDIHCYPKIFIEYQEYLLPKKSI